MYAMIKALAAAPFPTLRVGDGPGVDFLEFVAGGSLKTNPSRRLDAVVAEAGRTNTFEWSRHSSRAVM